MLLEGVGRSQGCAWFMDMVGAFQWEIPEGKQQNLEILDVVNVWILVSALMTPKVKMSKTDVWKSFFHAERSQLTW